MCPKLEDDEMTAEYLLIGVVSAAVLTYELLLSRVLAIHYWSYFASMIVSLAMLGFAASGTALFAVAVRNKRLLSAMARWFLIAFSIAIPVCYRLSESIHCMPLIVLWDHRQIGLFAANYLVLSLPFFFAAFVIGHYFVRTDLPAGRVYFANMFGSGVGVAIGLLLTNIMSPSCAIHLIPLPVLAAGFFRYRRRLWKSVSLAAGAAILLLAATTPAIPKMSEHKGLSKMLLLPDAKLENRSWSPFGYICVADCRYLRYAPGLALDFSGVIPSQKAIFTDGDSMSVVCRYGDPGILSDFFHSRLDALPYQLFPDPRVLVVGAGGGMDILNAVTHAASHVDALETDPDIIELMTGPLAAFSGNLYARHDVKVVQQDGRNFSRRTSKRYDLIILPAAGSPFASATGTSAQDTNYLLTTQGLGDFLAILAPGGALVINTWLNVPPRDGMKVFATAVAALKRHQITAPEDHLLFTRSLRTCQLMVFHDPIKHGQIPAVRDFCELHSFDRIFHPGIKPSEANRFNIIENAPHFNMCRDILRAGENAVFSHYIFDIRPASDDRPYFSHFFKWAALPELLKKTGQNVAVQIGWGYMFLLITLLQAVPLGATLILVPLVLSGRKREMTRPPRALRWRTYAFFSAIGSGFMLLEIAVIQQFARFMRDPIHALGLALVIFLFGSGMGAFVSSHRTMRRHIVFAPIVVLSATHMLLWLASVRYGARTLFYADVIVAAAMAFFMGSPFPQAIRALRTHAPSIIPWAWGINGFVSVLAALVAGLISISTGLTILCAAGGFSYLLAALFFPYFPVTAGIRQ